MALLQLQPSDITPGVALVSIDRAALLEKIEQLQARLDDLKPFVVRLGNGHYQLYQGRIVRAQTFTAQSMIEYICSVFAPSTQVRWFLLPADPPALNPS